MAEQRRADDTRQIGRRERAEGEQRADQRHETGKKYLVEDERRGRREDEQVIPLDGRADDARHGDFLHVAGRVVRRGGVSAGR